MGRLTVAVAALCSVLMCVGCTTTPPDLHEGLTDDEIRTKIDLYIPAGTPLDIAQLELEELGVKPARQMVYPATAQRPEVLFARLHEPGGFWVSDFDEEVHFVDLSFVLDPKRRTMDVLIYRDYVYYWGREPIHGPNRPPMGRVWRYPSAIPPPAEPLEGASPLF